MSAGKIANSATNSVKATPRGTHNLMGRTYQNEKELTHVMDEPTGKVYPGHGWPSLSTMIKIENFLVFGFRAHRPALSEAGKNQLMEKYNLRWDERKRRYTNSPEAIWEIVKERHMDRLTEWEITSYGELEYRATHR